MYLVLTQRGGHNHPGLFSTGSTVYKAMGSLQGERVGVSPASGKSRTERSLDRSILGYHKFLRHFLGLSWWRERGLSGFWKGGAAYISGCGYWPWDSSLAKGSFSSNFSYLSERPNLTNVTRNLGIAKCGFVPATQKEGVCGASSSGCSMCARAYESVWCQIPSLHTGNKTDKLSMS